VDAAGTLYVADSRNNRIRKVNTTTGEVTTYAGSGVERTRLDGLGTSATFWFPQGLAIDTAGSMYVADSYNHAIRKIDPSGMVTTVAGGFSAGFADGSPTSALFASPSAVALDPASGNLYVADTDGKRIRTIT
jgi:DNA-binding beta-propeller fold protein YncE